MASAFNLNISGDGDSVLAFMLADGATLRVLTTADSPEGFPKVLAALMAGDDLTDSDVARLTRPLEFQITKLDERVSINEDTGILTFDGEPIHDLLADTILRFFREGKETIGLVRFMENLALNPSRRSREALFAWATKQALTITPDGMFIGYKGVQHDHTSVHAGPANVNGVPMNGHVPNEVGYVISVDRAYVDDDGNHGCSHGLHVGNYRYARSWSSILLEVEVNPRDVVSVPYSDAEKLRCCEYKVLAVHEPEREDDVQDVYEPQDEDFNPYDFTDEEDDDFDLDHDFFTPLAEQDVQPRFLDGLRKALSLGRGRTAKVDRGDN